MSEMLAPTTTLEQNTHGAESVRRPVNPDLRIDALSEFIGRHKLAIDAVEQGAEGIEEIEMSALPIYDIETQQLKTVSELLELRDELNEEKSRDSITGAYKREKLFTDYPNGFEKGATVLMADVAGLGDINNEHGAHVAGDFVLKTAVEALREIDGVKIYRLSGDEFVIVAPQDIDAEAWDAINETYRSLVLNNDEGKLKNIEQLSRDSLFIRAGKKIVEASHEDTTDKEVALADEVETDIKELIKVLGTNAGVPLLATREELSKWLEDNKIQVVQGKDSTKAFKTWTPGKSRVLPKFFRTVGKTRRGKRR